MTTRVKICGITDEDDLAIAITAGADAIGVISAVPVDTPRSIAPEQAARLVDAVPPFVTSVLVTMPESETDVLELADRIGPDIIQVHGDVRTETLEAISAQAAVIRAVASGEAEMIEAARPFVDALLLDSVDERGAGGTGETHDWNAARDWVKSLSVPVILAGGLTPDNVQEAINEVNPYAVDVASGVENAAGKEAAAVNRFIAAVRKANGGTT